MVWMIGLIVLGAVIAVVAVAVPARRRRSAASPVESAAAQPQPADPPATPPMTGLESALAQVTDRDGRPIGERLDAESEHVDDLRVPDDTGPLLRRALDHVEHHGDAPTGDPGDTH